MNEEKVMNILKDLVNHNVTLIHTYAKIMNIINSLSDNHKLNEEERANG